MVSDEQNQEPIAGPTTREPSVEDLVELCRELNRLDARYLVVGGFAVRNAGYLRGTSDIDLLIDPSSDNEARVYQALEILPDKAVLELKPGEVSEYTVIRVNDEITVDLMASTSGISLEEAANEIDYNVIDGVRIPFASPRLLWRMKKTTYREKDAPDLLFLKQQYSEVIFGDNHD